MPADPTNLSPGPLPARVTLDGRLVRLEPLDAERHVQALFDQVGGPDNDSLWTYMAAGPYRDYATFEAAIQKIAESEDPLFFAIVDQRTGDTLGYASFLRIEPNHRVIEVGHIVFSPVLQRTPGATEAMYLMAKYVFEELGYRRYEWKCDALNQRSRRAALRLGFQFEGIFRQHMIVKGRNRDTAWFAMLDREWSERKQNFERWLAPGNFDADGRQRHSLSHLNAIAAL